MLASEVREWLELPEVHGQAATLVRWLQGIEKPEHTPFENAYEWLLDEHKEIYEFGAVRDRLIRYIRDILQTRPDRVLAGEIPNPFPGKKVEPLLANIFRLCSELRAVEVSGLLREIARDGHVHGEWNYIDLWEALHRAVAVTQADSQLAPEWFGVLESRGSSCYARNPEEAAVGAIWMPASCEDRDQPHIPELTRALGLAAQRISEEHIGDHAQQRARFDGLLREMRGAWVLGDANQWLLLEGIRNASWPAWAALRERLLAFRRTNAGWIRVLTPRYLADCLPRKFVVERFQEADHSGIIRELDVTEEGFQFLRIVGCRFEKWRRANPGSDDDSNRITLLHVLQEIHKSIEETGLSGADVEDARRNVFAQYNVATAAAYPECVGALKECLSEIAEGSAGPGVTLPPEAVRRDSSYASETLARAT